MNTVFGIKPFPWQVNVLNDRTPNVIVSGSRRVAKSVAARLWALRAAVDYENWMRSRGNENAVIDAISPAVVAIVAPTRQMAKQLHFAPLVALIESRPELSRLVSKINATDLSISFKGNRPTIVVGGMAASEGDRWRGLKIAALVCDEVQDISYKAISEALKPAMTDTKGSQALYIGSAKGKGNNALWKLYELSEKHPDLYNFHRYSIYDNPLIPRSAIDAERITKLPSVFAREYLAEFTNFEGMVFTELSQENLVPESEVKLAMFRGKPLVYLAADFGSINAAAVVVALTEDPRNASNRFTVLEAWQNLSGGHVSDATFNQVLLGLAKKYHINKAYADPSREGQILDIRTLGHGLETISGAYNSIPNGLQQVHEYIYQNKLVFITGKPSSHPNEVTGDRLYEMFAEYRWQTDRDGQVIEGKIPDGLCDHLLDSCRYLLARKDPRPMQALVKPKTVAKQYDPRLDRESPSFDPGLCLASARRSA